MRLGCNQPLGPLALADHIGLDTVLSIIEVIQRGTGDAKYRPCPLLRNYVDAGWLGRKTGRGVYVCECDGDESAERRRACVDCFLGRGGGEGESGGGRARGGGGVDSSCVSRTRVRSPHPNQKKNTKHRRQRAARRRAGVRRYLIGAPPHPRPALSRRCCAPQPLSVKPAHAFDDDDLCRMSINMLWGGRGARRRAAVAVLLLLLLRCLASAPTRPRALLRAHFSAFLTMLRVYYTISGVGFITLESRRLSRSLIITTAKTRSCPRWWPPCMRRPRCRARS